MKGWWWAVSTFDPLRSNEVLTTHHPLSCSTWTKRRRVNFALLTAWCLLGLLLLGPLLLPVLAFKRHLAINRFLYKNWPDEEQQYANCKATISNGIYCPEMNSLKGGGSVLSTL